MEADESDQKLLDKLIEVANYYAAFTGTHIKSARYFREAAIILAKMNRNAESLNLFEKANFLLTSANGSGNLEFPPKGLYKDFHSIPLKNTPGKDM